jgi:hypothetical protein
MKWQQRNSVMGSAAVFPCISIRPLFLANWERDSNCPHDGQTPGASHGYQVLLGTTEYLRDFAAPGRIPEVQ